MGKNELKVADPMTDTSLVQWIKVNQVESGIKNVYHSM